MFMQSVRLTVAMYDLSRWSPEFALPITSSAVGIRPMVAAAAGCGMK
jgi:hypothetical protein